jgi:hypothetical protein
VLNALGEDQNHLNQYIYTVYNIILVTPSRQLNYNHLFSFMVRQLPDISYQKLTNISHYHREEATTRTINRMGSKIADNCDGKAL